MSDDPPGSATDATLRRFEPGDGPALRRLHRAALADAGTNPADVPGTDDLEDVEAAYLDPGGEFLVVAADQTDEVVAMGGLVVEGEGVPPNAGELSRIAVDPDRQREGHGARVVDGLEDAARERGLDRVFLWTAQRQRAAVRFYEARGYRGTDHRTEGAYELLRFEKALDGAE